MEPPDCAHDHQNHADGVEVDTDTRGGRAHVRMAPTAINMRLTPMPIALLLARLKRGDTPIS